MIIGGTLIMNGLDFDNESHGPHRWIYRNGLRESPEFDHRECGTLPNCHFQIRKSGGGSRDLTVTMKRIPANIHARTVYILSPHILLSPFAFQKHPTPIKMLLIMLSFALISLYLSISCFLVYGEIPTTLDGPFEPVTIPFDERFRGQAVDLPPTDPRIMRWVKDFEPEQISISLSTTHDSVWVSWITGFSLALLNC